MGENKACLNLLGFKRINNLLSLVVLRKNVLTYIIQGLIAINDNNSMCGASFPRAEKEVRLIFNERRFIGMNTGVLNQLCRVSGHKLINITWVIGMLFINIFRVILVLYGFVADLKFSFYHGLGLLEPDR